MSGKVRVAAHDESDDKVVYMALSRRRRTYVEESVRYLGSQKMMSGYIAMFFLVYQNVVAVVYIWLIFWEVFDEKKVGKFSMKNIFVKKKKLMIFFIIKVMTSTL